MIGLIRMAYETCLISDFELVYGNFTVCECLHFDIGFSGTKVFVSALIITGDSRSNYQEISQVRAVSFSLKNGPGCDQSGYRPPGISVTSLRCSKF